MYLGRISDNGESGGNLYEINLKTMEIEMSTLFKHLNVYILWGWHLASDWIYTNQAHQVTFIDELALFSFLSKRIL